MSEMVERVARAMARADGKVWNTDADGYVELLGAGSVYVGHVWHRYVPMARAAIETMKKPTEEMVRLGHVAAPYPQSDDMDRDDIAEIFRAMIDAALNPSPPERER